MSTFFRRKGKRFKAEVNVRFHHDDGFKRKKVQLSSGEVDISGSTSDLNPSNYIDHADADLPFESADEEEAGEVLATRHYQRLQRAKESWSKIREAMLLTTFQNEGSAFGKKCFFCNSVANCRCLDCGPSISLCESCAVDNHTDRNIFHHVEILMVSISLLKL